VQKIQNLPINDDKQGALFSGNSPRVKDAIVAVAKEIREKSNEQLRKEVELCQTRIFQDLFVDGEN